MTKIDKKLPEKGATKNYINELLIYQYDSDINFNVNMILEC